MILVDTSVWVDHLRRASAPLGALLEAEQVGVHPFVIGEMALGNLRQSDHVLGLLRALPMFPLAEHEEVCTLVTERRLAGTGVGWVDAHLLASALLGGGRLWSLDRRLTRQAQRLGIAR